MHIIFRYRYFSRNSWVGTGQLNYRRHRLKLVAQRSKIVYCKLSERKNVSRRVLQIKTACSIGYTWRSSNKNSVSLQFFLARGVHIIVITVHMYACAIRTQSPSTRICNRHFDTHLTGDLSFVCISIEKSEYMLPQARCYDLTKFNHRRASTKPLCINTNVILPMF